MPRKQVTLDLPIRKSRTHRNKGEVLKDSPDVSRVQTARKARESEGSQSPKQSRQNELSKNEKAVSIHKNLERTPTKRKSLPDNDKENGCSPAKTSPGRQSLENQENFSNSLSKSSPEILVKGSSVRLGTLRVALSPLKLNSLGQPELDSEIMTRSQSPFKSPLRSCVNLGSPNRYSERLTQSQVGSPLRRLDFGSPAKPPLKLGMLSPPKSNLNSPAKCLLKRLDCGSPRRSPRKFNVENGSLRHTPRKLPMSPLRFNSPRRSPRKFDIEDDCVQRSPRKLPMSPMKCENPKKCNIDSGSPQRSPRDAGIPQRSPKEIPTSPLKCESTRKINLDFGSPRRSPRKIPMSPLKCESPWKSPRKFNLDVGSPRRSPRKIPMSPLKFSSPSTLVSSLSLSSPANNKKSVSVGLFKPDVTAYRAMRQSLNTGTPTTLLCRDGQIETMRVFLDQHLNKGKPGSLYVSGAPGTGKTASLNLLLEEIKSKHRKIFLNCMTLKTSASIYGKIVSELVLGSRGTEKENTKLIERSLVSSKQPILIVLDEIDQLDSKNQEVLYSIFEWPSLKGSKLVLVGIANALDLTDRVLPRLQSRPTFKPQLLHFPPYSKAEIVKIINQRIQEAGLGDVQVIRPTAIQFLAGKVASVAGDVRKALDVCRRAVELCEIQARRQTVLKPSSDSSRQSPRKSPKKPEMKLKMVEIPQVMAIFNEVYGSRVITAVQNAPESFSLQQKLLICCLLLFLKHGKSKDITLGKFHEIYTKVCKKRNIPSMDQSEFLSLCTLLESRGMLQIKQAKEVRSSKVFLRLNPEEAEQALGDRTLLASVLEDKESLGKLCRS